MENTTNEEKFYKCKENIKKKFNLNNDEATVVIHLICERNIKNSLDVRCICSSKSINYDELYEYVKNCCDSRGRYKRADSFQHKSDEIRRGDTRPKIS